MQTAKTNAAAHLLGKAGVGLVMFHFGRLGHEFTLTNEGSLAGDIWVDFGAGPEAVEVKSTWQQKWALRRKQAERVKWFALVNLSDGDCWLIRSADILAGWENVAAPLTVTGKRIIEMGARGLHHAAPVLSAAAKGAAPRTRRGGIRRVKKRLADGSIKIYEYET
jgi:hypothetical protein